MKNIQMAEIKQGFSREKGLNDKSLSNALLLFVRENNFSEIIENQYGKKYIIDGLLNCPDGTFVRLRSIWLIKFNEISPMFVTAYPLKK